MSAQVSPETTQAAASTADDSAVEKKQTSPEEPEAPKAWIHTDQAEVFFGAWIVLNAIVLAIETDHGPSDDGDKIDALWFTIDSIFNVVFLVEMVLRIMAEKDQWCFNPWNVFDAILVVIGILDTWILLPVGSDMDMRFLTMFRCMRLLRLMRVLRVLRLLRNSKELILLVSGIAGAFKAMVWGVILLGIMIFICALLTTRLVGSSRGSALGDTVFNDENTVSDYQDLFGTMPRSMFTLFQFTAEFQPDIVRDTWPDGVEGYFFTFFLILYTLMSNLVILNIIASIIVEVIMSISASDREEEKATEKEKELKEINEKCEDLFNSLFGGIDTDKSGNLEYKELLDKKNDHVQKVFKTAGLAPSEAKELFAILDKDSTGSISPAELKDGLMRLKQPPDPKDILRIESNLGSLESKVDSFMSVQKEVKYALECMIGGPLPTKVV